MGKNKKALEKGTLHVNETQQKGDKRNIPAGKYQRGSQTSK